MLKRVLVIYFLLRGCLSVAQPQFSDVDCWLYQLQNLDLEAIAATDFDLVVMDYSQDGTGSGEFSAAQIAALKASGKIVLAYLSIGEAEDYRYYWQPGWTPGNPPWLGPENPQWEGNYKVRYWMDGWQAILFGTSSGPDRCYLDRILQQGFDGVYLDLVDAYYFWGPEGEMPENPNSAADMVDLVAALAEYARVVYSQEDFLIIPQNGESLWDDAPPAQAELYLNTLNGMGAEDVFFYGDLPENNRYNPQWYEIGLLDGLVAAGKTVLSVEYLTQANLIDQYYPLAEQRDYVPYATVRDLDELRINPGHEPPPNVVQPSPDPRGGQPFTLSLFPRPGNSSLRIVIHLDRPSNARLRIFDITGRTIAVLWDGLRSSGESAWEWKAPGSGGIYFVVLDTEVSRTVAKALILK